MVGRGLQREQRPSELHAHGHQGSERLRDERERRERRMERDVVRG